MEKLNYRKRIIKRKQESVIYHFGNDKVQGSKRPELENQFAGIEEEQEMEYENIPDIKEEEEEDPLKIDDVKQEITVNSETGDKSSEFIYWSALRRNEVLQIYPQLSFSEITLILMNEWQLLEKSKTSAEVQRGKNDISGNAPAKKKSKGRGISRLTGFVLWCKEVRPNLLKEHPNMTFGEIARLMGKMWRQITPLEKYNYRMQALNANSKISDIKKYNEKTTIKLKKKPPPPKTISLKVDKKMSRKGRIISNPTKLADFYKEEVKKETRMRKSNRLNNSPIKQESVEIENYETTLMFSEQ